MMASPNLHRTEHAKKRQQQRGINDLQIDLIHYFGVDHYQKGGDTLSYVDEKMIHQLRCAIDKLNKVAIVKTPNQQVITALHMHRQIRTTQLAA